MSSAGGQINDIPRQDPESTPLEALKAKPTVLINGGQQDLQSNQAQVPTSAPHKKTSQDGSNGLREHTSATANNAFTVNGGLALHGDSQEEAQKTLRDHQGFLKESRRRDSDQKDKVLKLSPDKLYELTSSPDAIPIHVQELDQEDNGTITTVKEEPSILQLLEQEQWQTVGKRGHIRKRSGSDVHASDHVDEKLLRSPITLSNADLQDRPGLSSRTVSSPLLKRKQSSSRPIAITPVAFKTARQLAPEDKSVKKDAKPMHIENAPPSPMPSSIPLPPMSVPAYLQLELSSTRPSPLYIHRSSTADFPYESSRVKIDRLLNFLLLPWHLEGALWFGAFACLDAWLYTFTVLPLRFAKALYLLALSSLLNLMTESKYLAGFMYSGIGRLWRRKRASSIVSETRFREDSELSKTPVSKGGHRGSDATTPSDPNKASAASNVPQESSRKRVPTRHRRMRSAPSNLLPIDKADILKGLLILVSCIVLMYFDASMMYHSIRGQAAIKLYVIYNVLEVFDRLLSAIGQDVLECLFSKEALERKPNGRSKILRPFWLFMLALVYNVIHATALFYQVITLNVAVNSYSNALLTLLMSNQFVEIKSTVFKRFEKENLFQMTCADVVERFQLWLMLIIIASRNIIETNSLFGSSSSSPSAPLRTSSILPSSFTMFPEWTGQIMGPFFLVLGTETIVDWLKHAYISKFNLVKPNIYGRFLDVLAKDYYTNAFADQNLTRRLGLPVIPLSCLFIRASVQTYQMFLAIHFPHPTPAPSTSLSEPDATTSPATTAALLHIDQLFRRALGRHVPVSAPTAPLWGVAWLPSPDTLLAWATTLVFWGLVYLVMLTLKVLLGMALLRYARNRYAGMKAREQESSHADGRRVGGWGVVEVDEDKRRWVYEDDPDGLKRLREKERDGREREKAGGKGFGHVERYNMVAKRIW